MFPKLIALQKNYSLLFLFSIVFYLIPGCKKDLTPADNTQPKIQLTVEDVGVTEAWLRLNIQTPNSKNQISITRNDSTIQSRITGPSALDTLIYDSGLLPNQNYTYTAAILDAEPVEASASVEITTMDTTSHEFTWQSWTFGAKGSSILYDVAIINENDIWAVGEIYTEDTYTYDSLGNWIDPYNAVHWDGSEWELKRFYKQNNSGGKSIILPIRDIHWVEDHNIWLAAGSIYHWNGTIAIQSYQRDISTSETVEKLWYNNNSDIYGVGNEGLIVHYNGQTWQRIESGVNENINDIWGVSENESHYILATVSNKYSTGDTKLLKINEDNTVSDENWSISTRDPYSIWFMNSQRLFVCGAGIFTRNLNNQWHEFAEVPLIYTNRIRGNSINDIFVAGDSGIITHYNGISWKIFDEAAIALFRSLDYKNDIVVAVGGANPKATILMGQRQ